MPLSERFYVTSDTEQWVPLFTWFWVERATGRQHGPYPAQWIARLAGFLCTRGAGR